MVLLSRLASLRNQQGRYAEAEALYRQVLQGDGRNLTVLNNLAFLLTFENGKTAEAMTLINRAIEFAGSLPELLDTRALKLMTMTMCPLLARTNAQIRP